MAAGHDVVVVDNFCNSKPEALRRVTELAGRGLAGHYRADVRDKAALGEIFDRHEVDAVIHFAALKAVGESVRLPLSHYDNNIAGTVALAEVMGERVKSLVFSSSATVYGDPASMPIRESFPTSPTNPYGRTKWMMEYILQDVAAADPEWRVALLRYFNPVGAHSSGRIGEDPNGTLNNLMPFVSQVAIGRLARLQVFGDDYETPDGTGVRDYIHVVDLAQGHVCAVERLLERKGADAQPGHWPRIQRDRDGESLRAGQRTIGALPVSPAAARRHRAMLGGSCAGRTGAGLGGDAGHRRNVRRHMAMAVGQSAGLPRRLTGRRHDRSAPCCVAVCWGRLKRRNRCGRAAGGGLPHDGPSCPVEPYQQRYSMQASFLPAWPLEINGFVAFSLLILSGLLGGRLAQRTGVLPRITGFIVIGFSLAPAWPDSSATKCLPAPRFSWTSRFGLILFQLGRLLDVDLAWQERPRSRPRCSSRDSPSSPSTPFSHGWA